MLQYTNLTRKGNVVSFFIPETELIKAGLSVDELLENLKNFKGVLDAVLDFCFLNDEEFRENFPLDKMDLYIMAQWGAGATRGLTFDITLTPHGSAESQINKLLNQEQQEFFSRSKHSQDMKSLYQNIQDVTRPLSSRGQVADNVDNFNSVNSAPQVPSSDFDASDLFISDSVSSFVFDFANFDDLVDCAKALYLTNENEWLHTAVYYHKGVYYLDFGFYAWMDNNEVEDILSRLSEYGKESTVTQAVMQEYYKVIVAENAISVLSNAF